MTNRKAGWYWVKILHEDSAWEAMRLEGESTQLWFMAGSAQPVPEYEITEIGPRIPTPDDPWQCVPVEVTKEMMEAALDAYMPFGDMHLAIQAAIACVPKPTEGGLDQ